MTTLRLREVLMLFLISIISALTGFLFGFDEGITSGVLEIIKRDFNLTEHETGFMIGLLPFGALIAACLTGRFSDWVGRLQVLYLIAILFSLGTIGILVTHSFSVLCVMRVLLGLGIGMSVVVTPMYIAETAPTEIRGKLVAYFQLAITLGILCSYLINLFVVDVLPWRWVFALGLIPSITLFVGALFLPESPRWLYIQGRTTQAHRVLTRLYGHKYHPKEIEKELLAIKKSIEKEKKTGVWKDLFSRKSLPCLILGIALFFFQQVSGINVVIYYAPTIFNSMQLGSTSTTLLATVGVGTLNVLMTLVAMRWVEKWGRRPLLITGFAGTALSLGLIAFATSFDGVFFQWVSAVSVFLFIAFFAVGLGPLPYILISEVFPIKIRGQGMSLSAASNWIFNTLVVASFPILLQELGISLVFLFYAVACALGLLFAIRYTPETKGISLEEIEKHVHSKKPLRLLGR
jgi:sugar porter (SP) family MFS transporter